MPVLSVTSFTGEVPRTSKRLIPDNAAQIATNVRLSSGALAPFSKSSFVLDWPGHAIRTVYRMIDAAGADVWLAWETDVDAQPGPIADDTLQRVYFTGDNEPRVTTLALAISGLAPYPFASYVLGVYPPQNPPTLTPSGGSGTSQLRAARYRLVTEWGEESDLSPPVTATGYPNGTWTFGGLDPIPANTYTATGGTWSAGTATLTGVTTTFGLRDGETIVLAGFTPAAWNGTWKVSAHTSTTIKFLSVANLGTVSVAGTITRDAPHHMTNVVRRFFMTFGGVDQYFFIGDKPYTDTAPAFVNPQVGEALADVAYEMPPTDMFSLRAMANGIMVALSGKDVCFSEAFKPHAWPSAYRQTLDQTPVACAVSGTTVVIGTDGNPYTITGVEPSTMGGGADKGRYPWPCISRRGMVSSQWGVIYPSVEGFVLGSSGGLVQSNSGGFMQNNAGFQLIFPDLFTKPEMAALNPTTLVAAMYGDTYVGVHDTDTGTRAVYIDRMEAWRMVELDISGDFPYVDRTNGELYFIVGDELVKFEGNTGERVQLDWLSKQFVLARPTTFNAGQIRFDGTMTPAQIAAAEAAIAAALATNQALINTDMTEGGLGMAMLGDFALGTDYMIDIPPAEWQTVTLQVIVGGIVRASVAVKSEKPFRLPTGYRGDVVELRLQGNVTINAVHVATSMPELRNVP
ncbi:MAG: hypothetical protein JWN23_1538 [Rhodocyclales bacterium]|nr:hypothetical protein [Rhodocyclales bacterium]